MNWPLITNILLLYGIHFADNTPKLTTDLVTVWTSYAMLIVLGEMKLEELI